MDVSTCPECRAPATVTDRFVLESTDGPVEHERIRCTAGHWFMLSLATAQRARRQHQDRTAR